MTTHELAKLLANGPDEEVRYNFGTKILGLSRAYELDRTHPDYKEFVIDPNMTGPMGTGFMSQFTTRVSYEGQRERWYKSQPKKTYTFIEVEERGEE